ncbi:hypothetical protein [Tatumella sp. OPLPL6]|uniref:hypothetical protein n=1 Tax=Tatumella sp. OPLPL6 TaxID=1928657 RepID=UPI000C19CAB0|nr:hypothetical protein [Tatumella sp. OPLPL6]PIJ42129.1 hypothetical protein BOM24_13170 [Tatumella sp. OPLPL6]
MIALTEIRKLELIEECKKVMDESSPDGDIHPIYQIALASLTSQPFGYVGEDAVKDRERLFSAQVFADEEDLPGYEFSELSCPLYLSPPVPEIKFPEKLNVGEIHYELTEKYGLDVSVDQLERGLAEEVYSVAVNNFKRLNGWGE